VAAAAVVGLAVAGAPYMAPELAPSGDRYADEDEDAAAAVDGDEVGGGGEEILMLARSGCVPSGLIGSDPERVGE